MFAIMFCREEVVRAVAVQRERFELSGPMKARARECCNLVMVALYVFIPPSRGLEIRTLEIVQDQNFSPLSLKAKCRNALVMKDSGIVLHFHNYKTKRFTGRDELALQVGCMPLHKVVIDNSFHWTVIAFQIIPVA